MTTVVELRATTQAGPAVVQTQVVLSGSATSPRVVDRAGRVNKRGHAQALASYEAFGRGSSR